MAPTPLEQHLESWPLGRIVEYARNPRKNDAAVDRMCASMREFGFKIPCLVRSSGELVDGHLRLKAARSLGLKEIPVMLCDEWTAAQVKAFRLLVNRSATWADFDEELLALELHDLQEADFDLSLTAFDPGEIDELVATDDEERDVSQAESRRTEVRRQKSEDRRHNGACATILPSRTAGNVEIPNPALTGGAGQAARLGDLWLCGPHRVLCGDATSGDAVARLLGKRRVRLLVTEVPRERLADERGSVVRGGTGADWWRAFALAPGVEAAYVWHDSKFTRELLEELLNHLGPGELVYDPFVGSGTTLVAAESTGRVCRGMELNPRCVDVIVQRWQVLTGKQATREIPDAAA